VHFFFNKLHWWKCFWKRLKINNRIALHEYLHWRKRRSLHLPKLITTLQPSITWRICCKKHKPTSQIKKKQVNLG
jgi:hypothetical protein